MRYINLSLLAILRFSKRIKVIPLLWWGCWKLSWNHRVRTPGCLSLALGEIEISIMKRPHDHSDRDASMLLTIE